MIKQFIWDNIIERFFSDILRKYAHEIEIECRESLSDESYWEFKKNQWRAEYD